MAKSVSYSAKGGPTVTLSQSDSGAFTCVYSGVDELVGFRTITQADVARGVPLATEVKPSIVNAVKLAFATKTVPDLYSGAELDGVLMADGALLEPRQVTITTAPSVGTYNVVSANHVDGFSIYLTKVDGGETLTVDRLMPAGHQFAVLISSQNDTSGSIEIGVAARTVFEPQDIYPVTVTKTTTAADVVDVAGEIFTELVHDVFVAEGLTFGPEHLLAVQQHVAHCRETILSRFEN